MPRVASVKLKVGMEVHVELATRSKMFSRAPNPAHRQFDASPPNTLIDPTVVALPGALPVINREAVEMAMMVGLALGCSIAPATKWDRKSYFYPDLPKGYQISQYDLPLCFDGAVDVPPTDEKGLVDPEGEPVRIGIIRAHLEEDAGKLLHEAPGGGPVDGSIVDYNRAGTPLLEVVTQPDFASANDAVAFARMLRNVCRFLGVTEGVMQKGHMRFEPNINTLLTLDDGRTVQTPIVEIKNLNSFRSLRDAIDYELREQPRRWERDGRVLGPGTKVTRGWDEAKGVTVVQREKEDAHDYRYFPDPDLTPVVVDEAWRARVAARVPQLPQQRMARYVQDYELTVKEATALVQERDLNAYYEACTAAMMALGIDSPRAGRLAANFVLQSGAKRANERAREPGAEPVGAHELGVAPAEVARLAIMREEGKISAGAADELFGRLCRPDGTSDRGGPVDTPGPRDIESMARDAGMLIIRDQGAMDGWIAKAIEEHPQAAADVRAGKQQAIGRLVGAVMKASGGAADAKDAREQLLRKLATP